MDLYQIQTNREQKLIMFNLIAHTLNIVICAFDTVVGTKLVFLLEKILINSKYIRIHF